MMIESVDSITNTHKIGSTREANLYILDKIGNYCIKQAEHLNDTVDDRTLKIYVNHLLATIGQFNIEWDKDFALID